MITAKHGDDIGQCGFTVRHNFSSNVGTPAKLDPNLLVQVALHQYPDEQPLRARIARHHQVSCDQVLLCNGASEGIYLLARLFAGCHSEILTPTFMEYEWACQANHHRLNFANSASDSDVLWLCQPNNPTGHCYDLPLVRQWLAKASRWVIVDESYAYQLPHTSVSDWLNTHNNLIIIRSLTKSMAIPALRLGYVLAPADIIQQLAAYQPPWPVNSMALACAQSLWTQPPCVHDSQALQQQMAAIEGIDVTPSATSFFLWQTPWPSAQVKQALGQRYGILVRDASNIRGCSERCLRVASQGPAIDQVLLDAVTELAREF